MTPPDHQKGTNCDVAAAMVSPFKPAKTSLSLTLANSRRQLVNEDDLAWIQANRPTLLAEWEAEFARDNRPPTRQEIVQKMNFRAHGYSDGGSADFERGMNAGVRAILAEAITMPRDTDYQEHFNAGPALRNYTNVPRSALPAGPDVDEWWGVQSGRVAALRWLVELNREFADRCFPNLSDVRIV